MEEGKKQNLPRSFVPHREYNCLSETETLLQFFSAPFCKFTFSYVYINAGLGQKCCFRSAERVLSGIIYDHSCNYHLYAKDFQATHLLISILLINTQIFTLFNTAWLRLHL